MNIDQIVKDRSLTCTGCGSKGSCSVVKMLTPREGDIKCNECGKEWFIIVPMYQT